MPKYQVLFHQVRTVRFKPVIIEASDKNDAYQLANELERQIAEKRSEGLYDDMPDGHPLELDPYKGECDDPEVFDVELIGE